VGDVEGVQGGEGGELTLTLDRADGVYRPGEVIGITVEIQPAKDLKLRAGRVRLSGTPERFAFQAQLPPDAAPSIQTQAGLCIHSHCRTRVRRLPT
jgi:hypothetical protein